MSQRAPADAAPGGVSPSPSAPEWSPLAKILHWTTAILVFVMLGLGLWMVGLKDLIQKFDAYQLHKSIGLTVLALTLVRIPLRLRAERPPPPVTMSQFEHRLAVGAHALLYALLIAMPISGWLMASASPLRIPTRFFDLFEMPLLVAPDEATEARFKAAHYVLSWTLMATLAVHIAAALKHHIWDRDYVLSSMLPRLRRPGRSGIGEYSEASEYLDATRSPNTQADARQDAEAGSDPTTPHVGRRNS